MRRVVCINLFAVSVVTIYFFIGLVVRPNVPSFHRMPYFATNSLDNTIRGSTTQVQKYVSHSNKSDVIEEIVPGSKQGTCVSKVSGSETRFAVDLMQLGPFNYLENFRNPCFVPGNKAIKDIRCLPYYYLIGAPKSGTTDLSRRISQHPQVSANVMKEPHWLTRKRFIYSARSLISRRSGYPTLEDYLQIFEKAATEIQLSGNETYHSLVVGDCSASTIFDNLHWRNLRENKGRTEPLHTNSDLIYHLNPQAKIIAILRDPIESKSLFLLCVKKRLDLGVSSGLVARVTAMLSWYSDFLYFKKDYRNPEAFHEATLKTLQDYKSCFDRCSYRTCLNKHTSPRDARLYISLYYYHLVEFFRVFPSDQIHVLTMEEYSGNKKEHLEKIFNFLELDPISDKELDDIAKEERIYNANTKKESYGEMLNGTRTLLEDFFKLHNEKLEKLLGRTLWKGDNKY